jgi:fucose 4-O-acetylase-like acetyltransferase
LAIGLGFSIVAVAVEVLLHETGYFHWDYWWWNVPFIPLIIVFGYMTFFLISGYVYDLRDRARQLRVVGAMAAINAALALGLGLAGWL